MSVPSKARATSSKSNGTTSCWVVLLPTNENQFIKLIGKDLYIAVKSPNLPETKKVIYLFEEEKELQFLVKSDHQSYGKINLAFNRPVEDLSITILNNEEKENWSLIEKNINGDSVLIWLYPEAFDKRIELLIKDKNEIIDTVIFDLIERSEMKDSIVSVITNVTSSFDLNQDLIFTINRPYKNFDPFNVRLYEDSVLIEKRILQEFDLRSFVLPYDFKENTTYQLSVPPGVFEDIYSLINDTVKIDFKTKKMSDYGLINLKIDPNFSEDYIIQLSKNKRIIQEDYLTGKQIKESSARSWIFTFTGLRVGMVYYLNCV